MPIHVTTQPSEGWGRWVVATLVVAAVAAVLVPHILPVAILLGVIWLWLDFLVDVGS